MSTAQQPGRRIAFVGLGNMGLPMAANLVGAGCSVTGFDLSPSASDRARAAGITIAGSGRDAVREADTIITMLPAGEHVLSAYDASDGLLSTAPAGSLFIDCSTIAVDDARTAAQIAHQAGHHCLDAPVSGGVTGARAGTLTFMVGGGSADFAAAEPILQMMGAKIVHCGDTGAGQAAKLCNNMILGVSMIAVSEAFVLAESLGLPHQALFDVAATASGQCWALTSNCPVPGPVPTSPANRDYEAGFAVSLMAKDLGLAADAIRAGDVGALLGPAAARIFAALATGERRGEDFSTVVNAIRAGEVTDYGGTIS